MAYKTKYRSRRKSFRRSYKKRKYSKPGITRYSGSVVKMTRQLMPKRLSTKMVWSEVTDVVKAASSPYFILYSLNGLNDPNKTSGSTHKPMGFNELGALWVNYLVTGVKVIFEGSNAAAGAHQISIQTGTMGTPWATDPSAINEYRQGYSMITNNQRPWKFKKYYPISSILGIKKSTYDSDVYWGQMAGTTNPTFGADLYFQIANLDLSEQINTQVTVTFVYYVTFFNNKEPPPS